MEATNAPIVSWLVVAAAAVFSMYVSTCGSMPVAVEVAALAGARLMVLTVCALPKEMPLVLLAQFVAACVARKAFFHDTQVRRDCVSLSHVSRLVGKARAEWRERVAISARYALLIGQLSHAAFFFPFSVQRMYVGMLGALSHHIGMARRIFMASVSLRPSQLSERLSRSFLAVTFL